MEWIRFQRTLKRIREDPRRRVYTDQALLPVSDDETEALEMFTHHEAARNAVAHARKIDALTHGDNAAPELQQAGRSP
jgi:hypothetical protein